jgi:hypothetical protein
LSNRYLFISDTQIPFEASKSLQFCKSLQKEFKIPNENIYHVGDEVDLYHGSLHPKSPDAELTPNQELKLAISRLKEWYRAFPQMKLAVSNHGVRYVKKAISSDIPSVILKSYREILQAPPGWIWRERWDIKAARAPIAMIHGVGYSGMNGHRNAAIDLGRNTVIGHLHSNAGISKINTDGRTLWAVNAGCLIDLKAFAFDYGKHMRHKPVLSACVVIDGGLTPLLLPYERFA